MAGAYDGRTNTGTGSIAHRAGQDYRVAAGNQTTSLAELLERVLDKGIVIAGDITVSLAEVELLTIRVRLLIASIDKAQEIGLDWWKSDPALSSRAHQLEEENRLLREYLARLQAPMPPRAPSDAGISEATSNHGNGQGSQQSATQGETATNRWERVPTWLLPNR